MKDSGRQLSLTDSRLGKAQSETLKKAVNAPGLVGEARMFRAYLQADLAHAVMLSEQGIIPQAKAERLLGALLKLQAAGPEALPMHAELGSLLLQVERYIADETDAECAGLLQLARSRIDHNSAATRLDMRDGLLRTMQSLTGLMDTVLDRAGEWRDVMTPGYTHLQHAQPWILGHALLCQHDLLSRDLERLHAAFGRVDLSAQGTAALSGTSWPVDRHRMAELLGHGGIIANSKDAGVFAMDFLPEVAGALSLLMSNLGRLASELYIWSTWEFGLVELDEGLCGTSSIMPQKKNPYALERIRALAGEAIGWMPAQLGLLKSPTTTDCDQVFASGLHGSYFEATVWCIELMQVTLSTLRINRERMAKRAAINWSTSSALADLVVAEGGLDFRRAHHIVANLVRTSIDADKLPTEITSEDLDVAAEEILDKPLGLTQEEVQKALDAVGFVSTRTSAGGIAPEEIAKLLARADDIARGWSERIAANLHRRDKALDDLRLTASAIATGRS